MENAVHDIFLSYSHKDLSSAKMIASYLRKKGCTVWLATDIAEHSKQLPEKILNGLKQSKVFVALISRHYNSKSYQALEIAWAINTNTKKDYPIVPIYLRGGESKSSDILVSGDTIIIQKSLEKEIHKLDSIRKLIPNNNLKISSNEGLRIVLAQKRKRKWFFDIYTNDREIFKIRIETSLKYVKVYVDEEVVSEIESYFHFRHTMDFVINSRSKPMDVQACIKINSVFGNISYTIITIDNISKTFK